MIDSGSAQSDSEVQEENTCENSLFQNGSDDTIQTPIVTTDPLIRKTMLLIARSKAVLGML